MRRESNVVTLDYYLIGHRTSSQTQTPLEQRSEAGADHAADSIRIRCSWPSRAANEAWQQQQVMYGRVAEIRGTAATHQSE